MERNANCGSASATSASDTPVRAEEPFGRITSDGTSELETETEVCLRDIEHSGKGKDGKIAQHSGFTGKDVFFLDNGATYHVGVRPGEVYPRIITVGSVHRARAIGQLLDTVEHDIFSDRLFQTVSGKYKGVGVSVIGIGMGGPMMDFMVREVSVVQPTPLAVIRLGTCGLWDPEIEVGSIVTAGRGCALVQQNCSRWTDGCITRGSHSDVDYIVTKPLTCDAELNERLLANLRAQPGVKVADGLNVAADTFFACQARKSDHFENGDVAALHQVLEANKISTMEMESFTLMLLSKMRTIAPLYAAAAHVGVVQRANMKVNKNVTPEELKAAELAAGLAALDTLVHFDLHDENYPPCAN